MRYPREQKRRQQKLFGAWKKKKKTSGVSIFQRLWVELGSWSFLFSHIHKQKQLSARKSFNFPLLHGKPTYRSLSATDFVHSLLSQPCSLFCFKQTRQEVDEVKFYAKQLPCLLRLIPQFHHQNGLAVGEKGSSWLYQKKEEVGSFTSSSWFLYLYCL